MTSVGFSNVLKHIYLSATLQQLHFPEKGRNSSSAVKTTAVGINANNTNFKNADTHIYKQKGKMVVTELRAAKSSGVEPSTSPSMTEEQILLILKRLNSCVVETTGVSVRRGQE